MKIKFGIMVVVMSVFASAGWAIPSSIMYQGALKEQGLPANGTKTMKFSITNQTGNQVYWTSGDLPVPVTNGLFSTPLSPSGIDWEAISPYLEVSINGQLLLPREPVHASVYANLANTVVNGAITPEKIAGGYGLVPAGMIGLFASACPSGWTRFASLDGRFPLGGADFGAAGGALSHSHALGITRTISGGGASSIGTSRGSAGNELLQFGSSGGFTVDVRSADSDTQNHMPPYVTVVYCQKQ